MPNARRIYSRVFVSICVLGILLSLSKTIRVFSLSPRNLGIPHGAAEDWLILVLVLAAAAWTAWKSEDIAMVGRAAIALFSVCFAFISFQDVIEVHYGIAPHYIEDGRTVMQRSVVESALTGGVFLAMSLGIYKWRAWGHKLCLVVCIVLAAGCVAMFFEGIDWKPIVALAVLISVVVWLRLPTVRYRLRTAGQE